MPYTITQVLMPLFYHQSRWTYPCKTNLKKTKFKDSVFTRIVLSHFTEQKFTQSHSKNIDTRIPWPFYKFRLPYLAGSQFLYMEYENASLAISRCIEHHFYNDAILYKLQFRNTFHIFLI